MGSIVMIIIPIILPLVEALGFNLTWFIYGLLICCKFTNRLAFSSGGNALSAYLTSKVVLNGILRNIYGMMQFYGVASHRFGLDYCISSNCTLA